MVNDMKRMGFTLIELMGAVIILSLITLLAFPSVINMIKSSNEEVDKAIKEKLLAAAEQYVNDNADNFPMTKTNNYSKCAQLQDDDYNLSVDVYDDLLNDEYIDEDLLDEYNKNKDENEQITKDGNKKLSTIYVSNIYYEKTYKKNYSTGSGKTTTSTTKKTIQKYCYKYGGDIKNE